MLVNQSTPVDFYLRPAAESDKSYILATWLRQYKSATWARRMPPDIFYPFHRRVVEDLLGNVPCMVVANTTSPLHIVGYTCGEYHAPDTLLVHFVYVKHSLRRRGMGRYMLEALAPSGTTIYATHWTGILTKMPEVVYNPYLLFQPYRSKAHECESPAYGRFPTFGEWVGWQRNDDSSEAAKRGGGGTGKAARESGPCDRDEEEAPAEEGEVPLSREGVEAEGGTGPEPE